jgi:hypothetical protein
LATGGKYDLLATVKNPNSDYAARFSYRFVAGGWASPRAEGFILPDEEKFVAALAENSPARPIGASLEIIDTRWRRIDRHIIPDWKVYAAEHLNFKIEDAKYESGIELSAGKPAIGKASFLIINNTGYGYYDLGVLIVLYRGPAVVGVNRVTLSSLAPGESRRGEASWFDDVGTVTQIKIIPEADIVSDSTFLRQN